MLRPVLKVLVLFAAGFGVPEIPHASSNAAEVMSGPALTDVGVPSTAEISDKSDKNVKMKNLKDQPTIIIEGKRINYNGFQIAIGNDFKSWKKTIGGNPQCTTSKDSAIFCSWDQLGIEIASDSKREKVEFLIITINPAPPDPYAGLMTKWPDGSPYLPLPVLSPKSKFPGKLLVDGFLITSETRYQEFKRHADQSRNFRCGFKCLEPTAMLNESVLMYFRLVDYGENNRIETIAIE